MFFKIGVLKNFAIIKGKHLNWSLSLIKFQAFRPATLFKGDSNTDVFLNTSSGRFYVFMGYIQGEGVGQQKQPPEVFYKRGALINFPKFTGKHLR